MPAVFVRTSVLYVPAGAAFDGVRTVSGAGVQPAPPSVVAVTVNVSLDERSPCGRTRKYTSPW